jgi:CheY-like chemotaxis protein
LLRDSLVNLILNAAEAMPEGGRVTVRARREQDTVVVEVEDTGAGMSEEVRQRCREPFFTTKGESSSGLGLTIVQWAAQRHKGDMGIQSAPGKGTKVTLRIPFRESGMTEEVEAAFEPVVSGSLKLLVADDDLKARKFLNRYLTRVGHGVDSVASGEEALEMLEKGEYDLVITDLAMPGLSGVELAARAKKKHPDLPILLLTGFAEMAEGFNEQMSGFAAVLSKPIRPGELDRAISSACGGKGGAAG